MATSSATLLGCLPQAFDERVRGACRVEQLRHLLRQQVVALVLQLRSRPPLVAPRALLGDPGVPVRADIFEGSPGHDPAGQDADDSEDEDGDRAALDDYRARDTEQVHPG